MERSGTGYRRLADIGLAVLLVLTIGLSILAVRHVRSRPVAGGQQGGSPITPGPVASTGSPAAATSSDTQPSGSPATTTPAAPTARVLLLVGPARAANSWAGNATATGWPAVVTRAGWTIVRVPSLRYTSDAGASDSLFPGLPTPPLPGTVDPVAVVVVTSAADGSAGSAVLASVAAMLWHRLRVAYPTTQIVALGPAPVAGGDSAARIAVGTTLAAATRGTRVTYADTDPLAHADHVTSPQFGQLVLSIIGSGGSPSASAAG